VDLEKLNFRQTQPTSGASAEDAIDLINLAFLDARIPSAAGAPAGSVFVSNGTSWGVVEGPTGMARDPVFRFNIAGQTVYWGEPAPTAAGTLTYFGDASGVVTMENIIGELAESDVPVGSELVQIGNSVTSIGAYAFQYWEANNQFLVIPDSVTSIGDYAFRHWTANNQPLVIGGSVTEIGDGAFYYWGANNQPLVIPDSVETIGDYAFSNWEANDQPLVIPDSVTEIGSYAFTNWTANNQPLVIPDSVMSIGSVTFASWYANNQPLVIPDSVETIGSYAFLNWTSNNQPLVIPDSVTSIGSGAFYNWASMTEPIYCGFNFSAFAGTDAFYSNGVTQIYVKPGATGWTIGGPPQEIQGAFGVTVSNWDNYPNPIPN
jgi:hypothetical protein